MVKLQTPGVLRYRGRMGEVPAHPSMMQDTECMIPNENIRKWFFNHEGPSAAFGRNQIRNTNIEIRNNFK